jgi:fatty-acyl-CoA synthase
MIARTLRETPVAGMERAAAAGVVLRANLGVDRPDRLVRAGLAVHRWGTGSVGALAMSAARDPQALAVVDDDGALSYRELYDRSRSLAASFQHLGIGPGHRVGILMRNHRGFVEALMAVAISGADAILLNTGFSGPQLHDVLASEGIETVVHDTEFSSLLAGAPQRLLDEQACADLAEGRPPVHRSLMRGRGSGRLVILTSGTTGRPKGAARDNAGGVEVAAALLGRLPLRRHDIQVVSAPVFHGWGLTHLLLGLGRSATTVLSRRFDQAQTLALLERHRARVWVVVPVMLQRVLELGPDALIGTDLNALRVIAASGSALGATLATDVLARFGPVLFNVYGSTEVSIGSIATPSDLLRSPACAGKPAAGARVAVLDAQGTTCAPGVTGRVFVGNRNRFDGYTGGGGKEEIAGLLSTGDLGHIDRSGRLHIDGRVDDMIISGGENVYPQEVEDLLARHPFVREVAVVGRDDPEFGQSLVAYVAPREGAPLTGEAVQAFVREHLARFKVPRRVELIDTLPRTATGKVLRRELP